MPISCANWALKVSAEWALRDGRAGCSTQGQFTEKREDSVAVLVCRNVPEAVLTC